MTVLAPQDHLAFLDSAIASTIAASAAEVDRSGKFPRSSVDALAAAGLLGLISAEEVGGSGKGLRAAAQVVERLSGTCGSTAMILLMHYAATSAIETYGAESMRHAIAGNQHLSTLAFSEAGSRSHFWAPTGTATDGSGEIRLDAHKSWVTSAGEADSYVWSSRPLHGQGPMTLWVLPSTSAGLRVRAPFDGLGLRGNASSAVTGEGVRVTHDAMLGADGAGLNIALQVILPHFLVLSAAFSQGLMEAMLSKAADHLTRTHLEHLGQTLAEQPAHRARYAQMRIRADEARTFLTDTLAALEAGRDDATLRVLEVKAVASEAACDVADGVLRLCGGSAFRRELGVERLFRDALASRVMAPTTEALRDFVGRASLGMPLL